MLLYINDQNAFNYFSEILMSTKKNMFRVVVIGDTSVGKTCFINQLVNEEFSPNQPPTNGAAYLCHSDTYNSKKFDLQIWDTAGQERFRSLGPIYYRNASAAFVIFSVVSEESFASVNEWVKDFKTSAGEETVVAVIANKLDLAESSSEKVDIKSARDWAEERGFVFHTVSAMTGSGVQDAYRALIKRIFENGIEPKIATTTAVETGRPRRKCC